MKFLLTLISPLLFLTVVYAQPENPSSAGSKPLFIAAERTVHFKLGNVNIPVTVLQYGESKDIVYINVHDSEPTSYEAAKKILVQSGGTLIKIENKRRRNIRFQLKGASYCFDPNRIFSRDGVAQTLREKGRISNKAIDEVERFGKGLLTLIPESSSCIVSLHNNSDGEYSIKSYMPGGKRETDAKAVYEDSLQDEDDIVLTTDSLVFSGMAGHLYNSIWQNNETVKKDGSLSVYCGEKNRRYINIETEHGKLIQHIEMIRKLLLVLSAENPKISEDENTIERSQEENR